MSGAADEIAGGGDLLWRLFIGLALPDDVRDELERAQGRLRRTGAQVAWIAPVSFHISVAFLGPVNRARVTDLTAALDHVMTATPPFTLSIRGVGFFGRSDAPRVIWAGVEPHPDLMAGEQRVRAALRDLGLPADPRPYTPHVTLGRVKSGRERAALLAALAPLNERDFGRAPIEGFDLMRSDLRPEGARHTRLHRALCCHTCSDGDGQR